jgi:exopolyphosphatase/guanosine-5'-triphosphate,3'-diphosphate pyrophosphatase
MAARPRKSARPAARPPATAAARRFAAIDIGSNSIHMVVVEPDGAGSYRVLAREREMVRLGKSALADGALSRRARRDGLEALLKMTTLARLKGAADVVAVATSAVREAGNGKDFLAQVKALTGLDVRLLSGEEEARLVYLAVRDAVDLGGGLAVLVDVGGGSTEWSVTRAGQLRQACSVRLGSLRLAATLDGDPPSTAALERLRRRIRKEIEPLPVPRPLDRLVATSGTAICCGDLADALAGRERPLAAGGLRELKSKELAAVVAHLRTLRRAEIAALPAVGGPRSESILAGAVLLEELARHAGADRLLLCDRALREGLVLEALAAGRPAAHDEGDVRRRQVLRLAERTGEGLLPHAQQVARLAVRLFDLLAPVHDLGERERDWLEFAALLHDVGYSIHFRRHHKHSFYLIATATLDAFDPREVEILAHVARYHRGALPKAKHLEFAALESWQQRAVEKLAALLRLANALDRTHAARVVELYASLVKRKRVVIEVLSPYDVALELAAARFRSDLFERVFGRRLVFRQGLEKAEA